MEYQRRHYPEVHVVLSLVIGPIPMVGNAFRIPRLPVIGVVHAHQLGGGLFIEEDLSLRQGHGQVVVLPVIVKVLHGPPVGRHDA